MRPWRKLRNTVDSRIKKFAKNLRNNQTRPEKLLWERLRCKRLGGLRFRRQAVIRGYIVDFYCPDKRLAVEVDGSSHNKARDLIRDTRILRNCRINVIRFSNGAVENEIAQVLEEIGAKCGISIPSTNPQSQQVQQGLNSIFKGDETENLSGCANVENGETMKRTHDLTEHGCEKIVGFLVDGKKGCGEQVFSNEEVAQRFSKQLKDMGIESTVLRCQVCKMVHVRRKDG